MTRKQALSQAIIILSENDDNKEIINVLKQIESEMPLSSWTNASIIDAIETYALEHNNTLPLVSNLTSKNKLPSDTVIRHKFGISSINTFFEKFFPRSQSQNKSSSPYKFEDDEYFLKTFKDNYTKIRSKLKVKYVNMRQYEKYKTENTPHISTILKNCNCTSYNDLLILCGYKKPRKDFVPTINISYNDEEDQISELNDILKSINSKQSV